MQRIHIHIFVKNLQENIEYYSTLFNTKPSFTENHYAQWKLDNPAINFAVSYNADTQGIHHLGIEMDSAESLQNTAKSLAGNGIDASEQRNTQCCYARSDKLWPEDPQGILWELFYSYEKNRTLSLQDKNNVESLTDNQAVPSSCCNDPGCDCDQEKLATCCIS